MFERFSPPPSIQLLVLAQLAPCHSHTLTQTHTHTHTKTIHSMPYHLGAGTASLSLFSIYYTASPITMGSEYIGPIAAAMRSETQLYRYSLPCVRPASRSFCLFGRFGGLGWFCLWSTCGVRLIDTPRNLISYRHYSLSRAAFADAAEFKSSFIQSLHPECPGCPACMQYADLVSCEQHLGRGSRACLLLYL